MHMADALLSPSVGLSFCAVSAAAVTYSARRLEGSLEQRRVPLMGVLGAFVFAGQMVNFTIPGTGSSGHLIGGLLLAVLLGGHAALVTITSVLVVQSLFFADGGILALGANIFNMGVYPCLLGQFIVRSLAGPNGSGRRLGTGIIIAAVLCLELGALSVTAETVLSGRSDLPFRQFAWLMLAIHLPMGIVEGAITWAGIKLIYRLQPGLKRELVPTTRTDPAQRPYGRLVVAIGASAIVVSSLAGWLASANPDGLEWALEKVMPAAREPSQASGITGALGRLQQRLAFMADYQLDSGNDAANAQAGIPRSKSSSSAAGFLGGLISLGVTGLAGGLALLLKKRSRLRRRGRTQ